MIRELDDDSVVLEMVDSNLQRENIKPSEKAYAYKMKLQALQNNAKVYGRFGQVDQKQKGDASEGIKSRKELAKQLGLIDQDKFNFLWVTEFPEFEWSEEEERYVAMHHPFTMPMEEDLNKLESDPENVRTKAYDIVLNGVELGGGSVRIFQSDVQERMFRALGFTDEKAHEQFGFLLDAFKYGVPPHAGLAIGLDRFVMLLVKAESIREVIAFPKVKDASCLMTEAPDTVDEKQLKELYLQTVVPNSEE